VRREMYAWFLVERRPLGRPRHGWEDNMKMGLKELGTGCIGWIYVAGRGTNGVLFRTQ